MVPRPHAARSTGHSVVITRVGKVSRLSPLRLHRVLTGVDAGRYIEETIEMDHKEFKPAPQMNPFLDDFVDEGPGVGGRTSGGIIAQIGLAGLVDHL